MTTQKIKINLTKEVLEKAYQEHGSCFMMARFLGTDNKTIKKKMLEFGIDFKMQQKKPSRDMASILTKEKLEESYQRHGTLVGVAEEFDCNHSLIRNYMDKFGLEVKEQVRYTVDHDFFSRDNEESWYWAGFIASDGCVTSNTGKNKLLAISLASIDKSHLEKFLKQIKSDYPIRDAVRIGNSFLTEGKEYFNSSMAINSLKIAEDLIRFGIHPRKTYDYIIPQEIINHKLFPCFLRGALDGDGCYHFSEKVEENGKIIKKEHYEINITGTKEVCQTFIDVLSNICNIKFPPQIKKKKGFAYQGVIGGLDQCYQIAKYLYKDATVWLDRKYPLVQKIIELYEAKENEKYKFRDNFENSIRQKENELQRKLSNNEIIFPLNSKNINGCNFFSFKELPNEEQLYWAGYLAKSSYIKEDEIKISFPNIDHLNKFKDLLQMKDFESLKMIEIPSEKIKDKTVLSLFIKSKRIISDLKNFGLVGHSRDFKIPEWMTINSEKEFLLKHLVRGLFDASSYLGDKKLITLSGKKEYLENIYETFYQFAGIDTQNEIKDATFPGNYYITFSFRETSTGARIFRFLYQDAKVYLQEKYDYAMIEIKSKESEWNFDSIDIFSI